MDQTPRSPVDAPSASSAIEPHQISAVTTPEGPCAVGPGFRACLDGEGVDAFVRDERALILGAADPRGWLFQDVESRSHLRARPFLGELDPVDVPSDLHHDWTAKAGTSFSSEQGELYLWQGDHLARLETPARVVRAAAQERFVSIEAEPGVSYHSDNYGVDWRGPYPNQGTWPPTPIARARRTERDLDREVFQRLRHWLMASPEVHDATLRRYARFPIEPMPFSVTWSVPLPVSWPAMAPAKTVLAPLALPEQPAFVGHRYSSSAAAWFGESGSRMAWWGFDSHGSPFFVEPRAREPQEAACAWLLDADRKWALTLEEGRGGSSHLLVHRAAGASTRLQTVVDCDFERMSLIVSLAISTEHGGRGVLVQHGSNRHLLHVDADGQVLAERALLGPRDHHDEFLALVDGLPAHVVTWGGVARMHALREGDDRVIEWPEPATGFCPDSESSEIRAVSLLAPSTHYERPWPHRAYSLVERDGRWCIAGGERHGERFRVHGGRMEGRLLTSWGTVSTVEHPQPDHPRDLRFGVEAARLTHGRRGWTLAFMDDHGAVVHAVVGPSGLLRKTVRRQEGIWWDSFGPELLIGPTHLWSLAGDPLMTRDSEEDGLLDARLVGGELHRLVQRENGTALLIGSREVGIPLPPELDDRRLVPGRDAGVVAREREGGLVWARPGHEPQRFDVGDQRPIAFVAPGPTVALFGGSFPQRLDDCAVKLVGARGGRLQELAPPLPVGCSESEVVLAVARSPLRIVTLEPALGTEDYFIRVRALHEGRWVEPAPPLPVPEGHLAGATVHQGNAWAVTLDDTRAQLVRLRRHRWQMR